MNYYVTHCNKSFLPYAERLFKSLQLHSQFKIIFFTIDFHYDSLFSNVECVYFDSEKFFVEVKEDKARHVLLKPALMDLLLSDKRAGSDNIFLYLDADCFARKGCDAIFENSCRIMNYPLLNLSCQEYMMRWGRGCPFIDEKHTIDYELTLEAPLLKKLGLDIRTRTPQYLQTGAMLFDLRCHDFIKEWAFLCSKIVSENEDWEQLMPYHEETMINCILWQVPQVFDLDRAIINVPDDQITFDQMIEKLNNPQPYLQRISLFCTIPAAYSMKNLHFFHGKCSDETYNLLMEESKQLYLKIHSLSLGDTIAATPTLRKLNQAYGQKLHIITHQPEIFKNNPYIQSISSFGDEPPVINEKDEVFETFVNVGKRNEFGIEKKHNRIDIRQFHAMDLGFTLTSEEMDYDYIPDPYKPIEGLPQYYIALHVATTWESRSYAKEKWQRLIDLLNSKSIAVVLIGKNGSEIGFHNVQKKTINLSINLGIDLTNLLTLSQCYHVIDKAQAIVTMDSGLLHLAGATKTPIIQLGSSIHNELRAPYRKGSQKYKYHYIGGPCELFCASDMKYGIREWGSIQGVPPLVKCLEGKADFECHPDPEKVFDLIMNEFDLKCERQIESEVSNDDNTILFIAPHLSTGGSPEYLSWLIEVYQKRDWKVFVIEYCYYGRYEVQRQKIINMVGKKCFLNIGSLTNSDEYYDRRSMDLIRLIQHDIKPKLIHLNEGAEDFALKPLTNTLLNFLYNSDRSFKIIETIHNSLFNFENKKYIPDEFFLCSPYQLEKTKHIDTIKTLVEMQLPLHVKPEREVALKKLGLSPSTFHVLNVGLFTADKNQKFLYDLAEKVLDKDIQFHFVGNTCFFDKCGLTETQKKLPNCIIHGEKDNVNDFYAAMDLFVFPSIKELNPIVIKEALSWGMPIYMNNLDIYEGRFDNNALIQYIDGNNVLDYLRDAANPKEGAVALESAAEKDDFEVTFVPFPKVNISGTNQNKYNVKFCDYLTEEVFYESDITTNMWAQCNIDSKDTKIYITDLETHETQTFVSINKVHHIVNESGSLGDCLAWVPIIDEYAHIIGQKVNFYTPRKELFDKNEYPLINFCDYSQKNEFIGKDPYTRLGCFSKKDLKVPLQNLARNILGIEPNKSSPPPKLDPHFIKERPIERKYVCIAIQSTAQLKYWNNSTGWAQTVRYLKNLGYEVVCVDKHACFGKGENINSIPDDCIHMPGDSLEETINCIYHCEFFIGLSSGLSWVAWACKKPVIMICGFLKDDYHFYTPYYVQNPNVCNNCWHDSSLVFDAGDWMWCGRNKDFECSKKIPFEMVKDNIDKLIKDFKL